ncbi:hypothetical protein EC973_000090 [Apophysomyces ossiformis]|uniref:RRM domain-containing protein n=1 Tax=Apophysomyces ossiformis TaxID=679940 RepID=A0A8H7BZT6_9FUNG|nr:hypothetical protein EC973_000090 [Apophysomyces ossiformis]
MPAIKRKAATKPTSQKNEAKTEKVAAKSGKRVTFAEGKDLAKASPAKKAKIEPAAQSKKTKPAIKLGNAKAEQDTKIVENEQPKKTEPKKTESKKTEPKKTESKKTEPKKTEPKKTEPKKGAVKKQAEPKKTAVKPKQAKKAPEQEETASDEKDKELKEEEDENDDEELDELTEEQEEALRKEILGDMGSSSEGEDSSDEEEVEDDTFGANKSVVALSNKKVEQSKLETKTKFDKHAQKAKGDSDKPGVIYLGRIPHGFYEEEMKGYFTQFGDVTRLRLSRSRKTGKSKHYAFIEFASEEVAKIVAETMDNYMLLEHMLKCKFIPEEKVHPKLFNGVDKKFQVNPWKKITRRQRNKERSEEQKQKHTRKLLNRDQRRRARLAKAGIEYDFPGYKASKKD